jgi:UDP-N-acetylmuramate--alanine ligase
VAVITNIDLEHLDTYRDLDDLKRAFARFADSGPPDGVVIAGFESAPVAAIVPALRRRCVTVGIDREDASVSGCRVVVLPGGTRFQVASRDGAGPGTVVTLAVPGAHNARNALMAMVAARELGVADADSALALAGFRGMARRFEPKGDLGGVTVIDDYAHHPTEIAATLDAARRLHVDRRIVVLFQPHLYSRTRDFAAEFGRVLLGAHLALIAPIYPAREAPIPGVTSALIAEAARRSSSSAQHVRALASDEAVAAALRSELRPGDVLITMGAGDVAKFADVLRA